MDVHKRLAGKASGVHLHADKKLKYAICRFMWWFVSTCQDWCCCACVHNSRWHYAISRLALLLSGDLQRFMSLLSKKIEHRRGRNPRRKHTLPALQNDIYGQDDRELELVLHPLSSPNWVCSAILCRMTWLFGAIGMCPVGIVLRGCVFSGSLIWFCVHFGRTIPAIVCRTFDQMKGRVYVSMALVCLYSQDQLRWMGGTTNSPLKHGCRTWTAMQAACGSCFDKPTHQAPDRWSMELSQQWRVKGRRAPKSVLRALHACHEAPLSQTLVK